ncbi:hypothetical protein ABK040_009736 [Willaertia magna]
MTSVNKYEELHSFAEFKPQNVHALETVIDFSLIQNQMITFVRKITDIPEEIENYIYSETDNKVYMVFRKEMLEAIQYLNTCSKSFNQNRYISRQGKVLWGPGGAGKSTLLYFLANYQLQRIVQSLVSNFLVDNEKVLTENLKTKIIRLKFDIHNALNYFLQFLDILYTQTENKLLIALDQWDVLIKSLIESNNENLHYFKTFTTAGSMGCGVFFGACSSQTSLTLPNFVFRDDERQRSKLNISPYSNDSFKTHISIFTNYKGFNVLKEIDIKRLQKETGNLPRLLNWCFSSTNKIIDYNTFKEKAINYYRSRLKVFLERNFDTISSRKDSMADFYCKLYLFEKTYNNHDEFEC